MLAAGDSFAWPAPTNNVPVLLRWQTQGDVGDVVMMSLSMAVLVYMSMQLYRLFWFASLYSASRDVML